MLSWFEILKLIDKIKFKAVELKVHRKECYNGRNSANFTIHLVWPLLVQVGELECPLHYLNGKSH